MTIKPLLLIPMSGQGTRYRKAGYDQPKPMIPVSGVPMIQRLLDKMPNDWPKCFILAENHRETGLEQLLKKQCPDAKIIYVPVHSQGPGFALKMAIPQLNPETPVLVSYCDYGMIWDPREFEQFVTSSNCDSCLISYKGFHAHYLSEVKYAYSRMDGEQVVEVREKGSFTDNREMEYASAGAYYFSSVKLLENSLDYQFKNEIKMNNEFYTSLTVQALLQMKSDANVRVFEIPYFFQWGTPEDLQTFEYWEKTFRAINHLSGQHLSVGQVLMPMAGLGSRFAKLTDTPKPFLKVNGQAMYKMAQKSLPRASKNVFVSLESVKKFIAPSIESNDEVIYLNQTPEGQALSVEAGLGSLDPKADIIVSACDHSVALDSKVYQEFLKLNDADAAIFTIKGFPGCDRSPKSYAYVQTKDQSPVSEVQKVSVKKPISEKPSSDHLLVGTFWFRNKQVLAKGIELIKGKGVKVNGELYLDSVFESLMEAGHKVRVITLDAYVNWGDPQSLAEALYWSEVFLNRRNDRRERFPGVLDA